MGIWGRAAALSALLTVGVALAGCTGADSVPNALEPVQTVVEAPTPEVVVTPTPTVAPLTDEQRQWVAFQFAVGTKSEQAMRATYCALNADGRVSQAKTVASFGTVSPEQVMAWMTEWCGS